jgi:outer membrane protein assembly factor BamD (BamD/ComL family)
MNRTILCFTLPLLTACSLFSTQNHPSESQDQTVMSLWELYRDCRQSGNVETALSAARQLRQSADMQVVPASDLPGGLDGFVMKQPVRTTVDPKAMAASCTLQAAKVSLDAGRQEEAQQLLHAVVRNYPESEYAFYVQRAKDWMRDLPPGTFDREQPSISEL